MTPDLRELLGHRPGWKPKRLPSPPTVIPQRPPDADQWGPGDTSWLAAMAVGMFLVAALTTYLCLR